MIVESQNPQNSLLISVLARNPHAETGWHRTVSSASPASRRAVETIGR
jgi:hypothetical protein